MIFGSVFSKQVMLAPWQKNDGVKAKRLFPLVLPKKNSHDDHPRWVISKKKAGWVVGAISKIYIFGCFLCLFGTYEMIGG